MEGLKPALWIKCPYCGSETRTKVYPDTVLLKFPLYCARCDREVMVNVVKEKLLVCEAPDA